VVSITFRSRKQWTKLTGIIRIIFAQHSVDFFVKLLLDCRILACHCEHTGQQPTTNLNILSHLCAGKRSSNNLQMRYMVNDRALAVVS